MISSIHSALQKEGKVSYILYTNMATPKCLAMSAGEVDLSTGSSQAAAGVLSPSIARRLPAAQSHHYSHSWCLSAGVSN